MGATVGPDRRDALADAVFDALAAARDTQATCGACADGQRGAIGSRRTRQQFVIPPVKPGAGSANNPLVIPAKAGIHIRIPLPASMGTKDL